MARKKINGTENLYFGDSNNTVYERMHNGTMNPIRIGGAALVTPVNQSGVEINLEDESATVVHIAAGTTPTGSVTAGSWINRTGYDRGIIAIAISDVTPVGDLGGEFQISYSMDAGVTSTAFATLVAVANIGADDDQTLIVDISTLKNAPYFKVKEVMTGTLAAVTFGVNVYLERLRG